MASRFDCYYAVTASLCLIGDTSPHRVTHASQKSRRLPLNHCQLPLEGPIAAQCRDFAVLAPHLHLCLNCQVCISTFLDAMNCEGLRARVRACAGREGGRERERKDNAVCFPLDSLSLRRSSFAIKMSSASFTIGCIGASSVPRVNV